MSNKEHTLAALTLIASLACLGTACLALATETSRAEYVAAVEPICKANTQANEKILKNVKAEVSKGKLRLAGAQFAEAARALDGTYAQLKALPQPVADQTTLSRWLGDVKTEASVFGAAAKDLKKGDKAGAQANVLKLTNNANRANDLVLGFQFHYCRFEPSRFT
jgi:hypothetical protein